uniref:Uncharacterized protein n=1 Tax=Anguilla anguilla TaxID=7936 RepID=A0A0E9XWV6_ANGAN
METTLTCRQKVRIRESFSLCAYLTGSGGG